MEEVSGGGTVTWKTVTIRVSYHDLRGHPFLHSFYTKNGTRYVVCSLYPLKEFPSFHKLVRVGITY